MNNEKVKVVAYARFSSENQREASIEQQFYIITQYADKHDLDICKKFSDSAVSGTSTKGRTGLEDMITFLTDNKKEIKYVLCHKLDRLSRSSMDYHLIKRTLKRLGIDIIFVTDNIRTDDDMSIMQEALTSGMAEYYSKNLGKEVMRGLMYNAKKNLFTGGTPPLGFVVDSETKQLVIDEDEAEIITLIFERYGVDNCSYQEIINELNEKGYKTKKGNSFKKNSIHELLTNEKYIGIYTYNKKASKDYDGKRNNHKLKNDDEIIRNEGGCPQIISNELWDKVQKRLNDDKHKSYSTRHYYLLKDKIYCGECGERMGGNHKPSGTNKKRYTTYDCNGRRRKSGCKNKGINASYVETFVLRQLKAMLLSNCYIDKLTDQINRFLTENNKELKRTLDKYKNKLYRNSVQRDNIIDAIAKGYLIDKFKDKLEKLDNEKDELTLIIKDTKAELNRQRVTTNDVKQAKRRFLKYMRQDNIFARRVINTYIERVDVFDDHIEVTMNIFRNLR